MSNEDAARLEFEAIVNELRDLHKRIHAIGEKNNLFNADNARGAEFARLSKAMNYARDDAKSLLTMFAQGIGK